jgi:Protein of unknown function (DUF3108)
MKTDKKNFLGAAALVIFLLCAFQTFNFYDGGYRVIKNSNFRRGEKLTYLAHYSFLSAGESVVYLDPQIHTVNARPCYKVDITGKSIGIFAAMLRINDTWQSYIDTSAMIPHKFYRNIEEGKYRKKETVTFDHFNKMAELRHTTNKDPEKVEHYKVPTNVQDMVSGYYFLRTLDFTNKKVGDTISIDGFFENKNYKLAIKYLGKDVLSSKVGKINTEVIVPLMPGNDLFDGKESIKIWISNDANRIPIKIKAKMFVGAVEVDLTKYENLKVPLALVKK